VRFVLGGREKQGKSAGIKNTEHFKMAHCLRRRSRQELSG
jgi:hypothetical protein